MAKTQVIDFPNFQWIDIENPDAKTMEDLGRKHDFHPLDIADTLTTSYRSKIEVYPGYTFIVLLFPVFNRQTREIESSELNLFIGGDFIITIHQGHLITLKDFYHTFHISPDLRDKYNDKSPERLVYELLNKMFMYILPMIDHLSDDCDNIEKAIFSGKERRMISEILLIRRNVTDFRKIMQVHKTVVKKAINSFKHSNIFVIKKTDVYFESLLDYTKEIWDTLENLKERIEALQESNESQISFKLSDIMRILTIISVVTFPITLLATIFGMNTVIGMPFVDSTYGFWYLIVIMIAMIVGMLVYFKKKGWM